MKKIIPFVLLSLLIFACGGKKKKTETKPQWIRIAPHFKTGDVYHYEIEKQNYNPENSAAENALTMVTQVEFKVVTDHIGYLSCAWKYGETTVKGAPQQEIDALSDTLKRMMNYIRSLEVKFDIDSNGSVIDFTNFEECQHAFVKELEATADYTALDGGEQEPVSKMLEMIGPAYTDPNIFLATYCTDFALVFSLNGSEFRSDSSYFQDVELPNPFGGNNFPSKETTILKMNGDDAVVSIQQAIDLMEAKRILKETFEAIAMMYGETFDESQIPVFDFKTIVEIHYSPKQRLITAVYSQKIMTMNGKEGKSILNVKLVPGS